MASVPRVPTRLMGASARKRKADLMAEQGYEPAWEAGGGLRPTRPSARPAPPPGPPPSFMKGKGKGKAPPRTHQRLMPPPPPPQDMGPPSVLWIKLPKTAPLVLDSYPPQAPVVQYSPDIAWLLPSANEILADIVGDMEEAEVAIDEDGEWTKYPEVGAAVLKAGGPEVSISIATCASCGRWAVGLAGKLKQRTNCAALALCVALTVDQEPRDMRSLASRWPDFAGFLQSASPTFLNRNSAARMQASPAWQPQPQPWAPEPTKKSRRKNNASSAPPEPVLTEDGEPVTTFTWISLPPDAQLVEQGYPEIAPALMHDPSLQALLSQASGMLADMVADVSEDVTLSDDGDWVTFPEIGEVLKEVGFEEKSLCIAACSSQCRWAVGMAGKWKQRETAAKLALCVALAADHPEEEKLREQYPDLFTFCEEYGVAAGDGDDPPRRTSIAPAVGWTAPQKPAKPAKAVDPEDIYDPEDEPPAKREPPKPIEGKMPLERDAPLWIKLPDDYDLIKDHIDPVEREQQTQIMEDYPPVAFVVATDGTKRKGLYSRADEELSKFLEEPGTEVEYHDDFDWKKFPVVGLALKELAEAEECMCVSMCPSRNLWAVGIGMKGKSRFQAAKVAMATSLALQRVELDEEMPDLEDIKTFEEFVEEARGTEKPE
mmetsp:Transcript_27426/g.50394  ORF Transcript_27426/g.50394 Transcript_27426/m.50394 type:complete len:658 (-) Transcript_27426:168-2141(-)